METHLSHFKKRLFAFCCQPRKCKKQLGFSIVELLLVMFILAIALMGLMALQLANIRSISGNKSRELAVFLAKSLLDEIQATALAKRTKLYNIDPPASIANSPYIASGSQSGSIYYDFNGRRINQSVLTGFNLNWRSDAAANNIPDTKEVSVQVIWFSEAGPNGATSQRSVFMNRLIQY